jgi:hypothetical protein
MGKSRDRLLDSTPEGFSELGEEVFLGINGAPDEKDDNVWSERWDSAHGFRRRGLERRDWKSIFHQFEKQGYKKCR